jgi:organic hydroperoxide reductase OsmC/OhrA
MYRYETAVTWRRGKEGEIHTEGKPAIQVAMPAEFGGPAGIWSPEELLVGSVASCLMSTFLHFIERLEIRLASYESRATGTMEKTPDGLRFTAMEVAIVAKVERESDYEKALAIEKKLEKYCPVSTALNFPVRLRLEVAITE